MNELLFHSSWWLLGCVAVGGIAFFIAGNRRLDKNLQRIGIAIFLLAVVLGLLRFFFPTPRERMEIRTRDIVHAVSNKDYTTLASLLDDQTAVCNPSRVLYGGKDAILATVKGAVDDYHLKSVSVIGMDSTQTETVITVSLEVYTTEDDAAGHPDTSSWQFEYEQSGDQWLLTKITVLSVDSEGIQDFNPRLPSPQE